MIQLSSAGKHFGSKTLFEGLNWVVNDGDRIGLVGGNGTGKSTLLKVLAGIETLDEGSFFGSKGATTGYLPQDGMSLSGARSWKNASPSSAVCLKSKRRWKR
jgi:ATP-binding cassette subfamily F protein 3